MAEILNEASICFIIQNGTPPKNKKDKKKISYDAI